jgi:hypothetical protein
MGKSLASMAVAPGELFLHRQARMEKERILVASTRG